MSIFEQAPNLTAIVTKFKHISTVIRFSKKKESLSGFLESSLFGELQPNFFVICFRQYVVLSAFPFFLRFPTLDSARTLPQNVETTTSVGKSTEAKKADHLIDENSEVYLRNTQGGPAFLDSVLLCMIDNVYDAI